MSDLDRALAWATTIVNEAQAEGFGKQEALARALLAEHERAEANAADARRWRVVREDFMPFTQNGSTWLELVLDGHDADAAADALADQQEGTP